VGIGTNIRLINYIKVRNSINNNEQESIYLDIDFNSSSY